jgi:hypothetical protein
MSRGSSNGDELDTDDDDLWVSDYKGEEANSRAQRRVSRILTATVRIVMTRGKILATEKNADEGWDSD